MNATRAATAHAAHPRSRGENAACMSSIVAPFGSSPLARGKQPRPPRREGCVRLIPARAGKTRYGIDGPS